MLLHSVKYVRPKLSTVNQNDDDVGLTINNIINEFLAKLSPHTNM